MKKLFFATSFFVATSLFGFEACGATKEEALYDLSTNIKADISNEITQAQSVVKNNDNEDIENRIDTILRVSSNLSLTNIKTFTKENQICVSIIPSEQIENTEILLTKALSFTVDTLPNEINEKVKTLKSWIEQIQQANNLVVAFLKPSFGATQTSIEIADILNKLHLQEKTFNDIYSDSILQAEALIFKSCASTKDKAYQDLNQQLFKSKTKQKDSEGFFDKLFSAVTFDIWSKDDVLILDLFQKQVTYIKDKDKECAIIKKEELFNVAAHLIQDVERFSTNTLSKDQKERYFQIKDYQEHLNVTKALLEIFPNKFQKNNFNTITTLQKELAEILENTHPQYVLFEIIGDAQNVQVMLGDKVIETNKKYHLKEGNYIYTISAKERCPIKGEFKLNLLDETRISKDFSSMNLPIVNFYTNDGTRIVIDGRTITPNVETTLPKCEGEVRYIASFANQEKSATLKLSPNFSKTIELSFLTPAELAILSDAKTKHYTTSSGLSFSESLTPLSNPKIKFSIKKNSSNGDLDLHESGSFTYTSKKDFVGIDSFLYVVKINGETSAPKVVNITINVANAPVAPKPEEKPAEKVEEKKEETKVTEEKKPEDEERYQKFKTYVESQEQDIEKLQKLQKTYPDLFNRLLQEKTATGL
ncbi:MAG: Ig-like domain-containing protein [Sulfurimonadaceae bacterium]|jgi:hypothetical protein|nr:Ig-like domain-containing protein [Sulfurimonadaceae bacterium]